MDELILDKFWLIISFVFLTNSGSFISEYLNFFVFPIPAPIKALKFLNKSLIISKN